MLHVLLFVVALHAQDPHPAVGLWQGYWARDTDTLLVTLDIQPGDSANRYRASFSSDRLRVAGIPFNSAERDGCCRIRLTLRGDATTLVFDGRVAGDSITGTFTESGANGTFALRRGPRNAAALREEAVTFSNGAVRLSGTLIVPNAAPPYPAIVMAHGSGAEGRFANRFLARRFAQAGIATLIFDKRGVGQSSGDWRAAGFEELAADVASGVAMLRVRRDINARSIGLFGHSQGATILPLIDDAAGGVAFLIASAASGVATESAERFSLRNATGYATLPPSEAAQANQYVDAVVRVAYHGEPRARLDSLATALAGKPWFFPLPGPDSHYWAFSRRIAGYEPQTQWMKVKAPVLLMYGAGDQRVPPEASVQTIRGALVAGHHQPPIVCVYAGADHTERVRKTGDIWPRNADGYLEDLIAWTRAAAGLERLSGPRDVKLSGACNQDLLWRPSWPGTEMVIVRGDPYGTGPFTFRFRMPAGYWIHPHSHPVSAYIQVISGTFLVGMGTTLDSTNVRVLAPGQAISVEPGMNHFEGTRGPTVIEVSGTGPWGITFVAPTKAP